MVSGDAGGGVRLWELTKRIDSIGNVRADTQRLNLYDGPLPVDLVDTVNCTFDEAGNRTRMELPGFTLENERDEMDRITEIRVDGLLCLFDVEGPCANGVKDSHRTKTQDTTTRTLSIVWGTNALEGRTRATVDWYRSLLERAGAETEDAPV